LRRRCNSGWRWISSSSVAWLAQLFGRPVALSPAQAARLDRWRALPEPDLRASPAAARFVVADVEATGLEVQRDRLIAIGAVTVESARIDLGRSFYVVLRQSAASDRENILVHGIGGTAQRAGEDPAEALLAFLEFAGKAPLVGFHAGFDDAMIRRAMREFLGEPYERRWIDLAQLAPELMPEEARARRNLDAWLERFGIEVFSRHDAVADALATAQLFLAALPRAAERRIAAVEAMLWEPGASRWLGGHR
jgi:DNA polymerase III subunit epsilon